MQMEQQPTFDNSFISGVIVNENNCAAIDEDDTEATADPESEADTFGALFFFLPPPQH